MDRVQALRDDVSPPPVVRVDGRDSYLEQWRQLDDALSARVREPVVCFGVGEAAGLLRAYAPRAWTSVTACTADEVSPGRFGDLPILPLTAVDSNATVLLGVRPDDQQTVAERLRSRFATVVAWYDLVDGSQHV
jgi:hypothetical protein